MQYKQKYPTTYVGEKQLHECIIAKYVELAKGKVTLEEDLMRQLEDQLNNDQGIQEKIERMFKMFQGIKPAGAWAAFVGFREVNIQTFVIQNDTWCPIFIPRSCLQQKTFRNWTALGVSYAGCSACMTGMVMGRCQWRSCLRLSSLCSASVLSKYGWICTDLYLTLVSRLEDYSSLVNKAMSGYNIALYEDNSMMVTEEEFVFDSNMNKELKEVIQHCRQLTIEE